MAEIIIQSDREMGPDFVELEDGEFLETFGSIDVSVSSSPPASPPSFPPSSPSCPRSTKRKCDFDSWSCQLANGHCYYADILEETVATLEEANCASNENREKIDELVHQQASKEELMQLQHLYLELLKGNCDFIADRIQSFKKSKHVNSSTEGMSHAQELAHLRSLLHQGETRMCADGESRNASNFSYELELQQLCSRILHLDDTLHDKQEASLVPVDNAELSRVLQLMIKVYQMRLHSTSEDTVQRSSETRHEEPASTEQQRIGSISHQDESSKSSHNRGDDTNSCKRRHEHDHVKPKCLHPSQKKFKLDLEHTPNARERGEGQGAQVNQHADKIMSHLQSARLMTLVLASDCLHLTNHLQHAVNDGHKVIGD